MEQRAAKHAANLIGLEATCTVRRQSRLPICFGGGSRTSKNHYGTHWPTAMGGDAFFARIELLPAPEPPPAETKR
jgi:hypothetical protein